MMIALMRLALTKTHPPPPDVSAYNEEVFQASYISNDSLNVLLHSLRKHAHAKHRDIFQL